MSIEGQGHFFTIYFPDFVCFVLYYANISGERLQDHWSSGSTLHFKLLTSTYCDVAGDYVVHYLLSPRYLIPGPDYMESDICSRSSSSVPNSPDYDSYSGIKDILPDSSQVIVILSGRF